MKADNFLYRVWDNQHNRFVPQPLTFNNQTDEVEIWTGMQDSKGQKIFDGDIVLYRGNIIFFVEFYNGSFCLMPPAHYCDSRDIQINASINLYDIARKGNLDTIKVVGNIHENPEILQCGL